jgi:nitroimidazol reductase NimA-like FMN-containing flavoprotein (pyridoxamine 5'-phosphate oxidase superfamily)
MSESHSHMEILRQLLESQLLGVLGTQHDGEPYTSLVGFVATSDLKSLLFTTGRSTRKLANLTGDARASMLIDNRANRPADFTDASAVTAVGVVQEVGRDERAEFERLYLAKHPQLEEFVRSPSCVPLRLRVSVFMVVTQFQHVIELHVDS